MSTRRCKVIVARALSIQKGCSSELKRSQSSQTNKNDKKKAQKDDPEMLKQYGLTQEEVDLFRDLREACGGSFPFEQSTNPNDKKD